MGRIIPNIFTSLPGQDVIALTIEALFEGRLIGDIKEASLLRDMVIYVPTRRSKPFWEAAFKKFFAGKSFFMPQIKPLAETEDFLENWFSEENYEELADDPSSFSTISSIERTSMLFPIVERWHSLLQEELADDRAAPIAKLPIAALREQFSFIKALEKLIDEMYFSNIPLEELQSLLSLDKDSEKYDSYWEKTREFLGIASTFWPQILKENKSQDASAKQVASIEKTANLLQNKDPETPILIVGSTGSIPATAQLMRVISRLKFGAVILPGLDLELDETSWDLIGNEKASVSTRFAHAQTILKYTINRIGILREDVKLLKEPTLNIEARNKLLCEIFRPAETIENWRDNFSKIPIIDAIEGISYIEADQMGEEARIIAVLIREALENPQKRVALVTMDRKLSKRVEVELQRWNISLSDSAGLALTQTEVGQFLRLFLKVVEEHTSSNILSFLRHPLFMLDRDESGKKLLIEAFEICVLRGRYFSSNMPFKDRVRYAFADNFQRINRDAFNYFSQNIIEELHVFAAQLDDLFAPFIEVNQYGALADFADKIANSLIIASRTPENLSLIEQDETGVFLLRFIENIKDIGGDIKSSNNGLRELFLLFLADISIMSKSISHPRAFIFGPLEARLIPIDRMILSGMNEGIFPASSGDDPFLNRAMRISIGLSTHDKKIGQSAHDFLMLAGTQELFITRSRKKNAKPTLPSRFLRRFSAFVRYENWQKISNKGNKYHSFAKMLDEPCDFSPCSPPAPIPKSPRFPCTLSITEIEKLRRDPYSIYAKHILCVAPLEKIEPELDARAKGNALHAAFEEYAIAEPPKDPEIAKMMLREIGERKFAAIAHERELHAFWFQRFLKLIPEFVAFDRKRRDMGNKILVEIRGGKEIKLKNGEAVSLRGKIDRVEIDKSGAVSIFDYKSGQFPNKISLEKFLAPQLPISAALVKEKAFASVKNGDNILEFGYIPIDGKKSLDIIPLFLEGDTSQEIAHQEWEYFLNEAEEFSLGIRPYHSRIAPIKNSIGDYDHLARVAEWDYIGGADEMEEGDGQ